MGTEGATKIAGCAEAVAEGRATLDFVSDK
jgi:hypothetical protein